MNKVHPVPMHRRLPLCVAIALTVAGMFSIPRCGVRGSLDKPPGAKNQAGDATPGTPGEPVPHKPFILDPLIR